MALSFPPRPSPTRPRKRPRAAADVDGDHSCLHKKKRRLRLFLITSRLSPQFSHPATNIVDRGMSKIAVWARQKALGRNLLRKAAIFNRLRRGAMTARGTTEGLGGVLVEQEKEQEQLKLAKLAFVYGSHDTHTRPVMPRGPSQLPAAAARAVEHFEVPPPAPSDPSSQSSSLPFCPLGDDSSAEYRSPNDAYNYSPPRSESPRRSYIPLPPSPLGLSNYDAFDIEDDVPDPYAHLDDDFDDACDEDDDVALPSPADPVSQSFAERRDSGRAFRSPPQPIYSDFSILDPGEPVVGDYDQVDEGADAVWPSALVPDTRSEPIPPLSSPDFRAIFATTQAGATSLSPNFMSSSMAPSPTPNSSSPNFVSTPTPADRPGLPVRSNKDEMEEERERQKRLMFMSFGT